MVAAHKPQQALVTASLFGPVIVPIFTSPHSNATPTLQSGPNSVLPPQPVPSSVQHLQSAPFSSSTQTNGLGPEKSFLSAAQHTIPTEPFSYGSLSLSDSIPKVLFSSPEV
ncbi:gamma-irradiation and mitomycin c induced 1 [Striga asiatica]|uniref:Gamma-irradiation and mitomycin c induced 1 n=1 Tax=Striga asiatica TaxID=4170 RepID=A0A5A7Q995_STRAF|nr:gamma-irradiation and mitomycin c induced 1 [Striga asiatica]